jgi:hypothetical protein
MVICYWCTLTSLICATCRRRPHSHPPQCSKLVRSSRRWPTRFSDRVYGLNAAESTELVWPFIVCSHFPVATLQIRTVLSSPSLFSPEETTFCPSGLNAAELTAPLWPCIVCSHSPVATLQIRTVLSTLSLSARNLPYLPLAETTFRPSGLNATEFTALLWPFIVCSQSPVATLQI